MITSTDTKTHYCQHTILYKPQLGIFCHFLSIFTPNYFEPVSVCIYPGLTTPPTTALLRNNSHSSRLFFKSTTWFLAAGRRRKLAQLMLQKQLIVFAPRSLSFGKWRWRSLGAVSKFPMIAHCGGNEGVRGMCYLWVMARHLIHEGKRVDWLARSVLDETMEVEYEQSKRIYRYIPWYTLPK